jgi:N6-L-threonylcarbamoyladenine synthase
MTILGIETSCDDTGVAVLEATEGANPQFAIRSNVIASQIDVHQEYGGVFPSLAKREHIKNLPTTLEKALKEAGVEKTDAIAVTYGPGLAPCLWTGINFAKDLAQKWNVPLVPVDHMEGHLLVGLLQQTNKNDQFSMPNDQLFPAVALIVSGGHTQLVLVKDIGSYQMIGETRDDAAGECFDKTARILGLPYPGGPELARQAAGFAIQNSKFKISLPRPMMHTKDYDFSFSGLKTAVLYDHKARPQEERETKEYIQEMAAEIQQSVIDVLLHKTLKAAEEFGAQSVILGGGVSANEELRKQLSQILDTKYQIPLLAPPKNLSTDNGLMIALAGYFTYKANSYEKNFEKIEAAPNLRIA